MTYQTKEKGLIKLSVYNLLGGGHNDRITYGGVVVVLCLYLSEQCPELILGTLIKTRNFVTFYKFLSHLGVHHTGRFHKLPGTKSYVFLCRSQPTTIPKLLSTCCDLNSTSQHKQQSPRILADCCMRQRQEWDPMSAVGRRGLPWLVGHGLASFS
jgi:hypothetical protein